MSVSTKRLRIAKIAKQKRHEPITLLHHYIDEEWLQSAFESLNAKSAPGIDMKTVEEYRVNLEENLQTLLGLAKSGRYKAPPVRRIEIPKPGGKEKRPIGIPTVEDKVLQKAVHMVLEPVYELEFYPFSYGFRPRRSCHQALEYLWKSIMDNNIQWILDLDIRKFFDTVKHEVLRDLLHVRVRDGVITRLIGKWLSAGVLRNGSIHYSDEGTPQGGIISPLMSNIYLHEVLDKWYDQGVCPRLKARSFMVRYADDVVMGFESKQDAEEVLRVIRKRLLRYGLELHPDKTRLVYFARPNDKSGRGPRPGSFDFLGFTHFWAKSHRGYWAVRRKTSKQKSRLAMKKVNEWCRKNRHEPLKFQYEKLCQKLKGHYAYYGITGNHRGLSKFFNRVRRIWKRWLNRRGWRGGKLNWERYAEMLKYTYPLPLPRIVHSIYTQRIRNSRNRMR